MARTPKDNIFPTQSFIESTMLRTANNLRTPLSPWWGNARSGSADFSEGDPERAGCPELACRCRRYSV
jgi:hypothetical protein